jgi:hypothetical protein
VLGEVVRVALALVAACAGALEEAGVRAVDFEHCEREGKWDKAYQLPLVWLSRAELVDQPTPSSMAW